MASGICDYHVHYYMDQCAQDEMTLVNIEQEAVRLGIDEICVLKHYSHALPNGEGVWVHWKKVVPEQFESFLNDIRAFQPSARVSMLAGVETELVDDAGTVNIPKREADRLDALILSVHWLPAMATLAPDPGLIPGRLDESPAGAVVAWHQKVREAGAEAIVMNFVKAYVRAIECNPKVLVLGHMSDGLRPLRKYDVPVDELSDENLNRLMEPLMAACVEHRVLWELESEPVKRPSLLKKANELGVRFTGTADAHFLHIDGWANLRDHSDAEAYIASLGLTKGTIRK